MHISALENARRFFVAYAGNLQGGKVVDIGAQNVNGSISDVCPESLRYVGVDFVAGNGVDVVLDDPYRLPFDDGSVDIVTASSTFEHSEFFWLLFLEIVRILKPHGLFYLNVPSNGPFHRYPVDCWRFYPDSGAALARWANHNGHPVALLESYTSEQHVDVFNDFVAVFVKDQAQAHRYPDRITRGFGGFTNARVLSDEAVIRQTNYPQDQRGALYFVKRNLWKLWRNSGLAAKVTRA